MKMLIQLTAILMVGAILGCSTEDTISNDQKVIEGLQSYKWGTDIADLPDTWFEDLDTMKYRENNEVHVTIGKLGDVELLDDALIFEFSEDKLIAVSGYIKLPHSSNGDRFREILENIYGKPTEALDTTRESWSEESSKYFNNLAVIYSLRDQHAIWTHWIRLDVWYTKETDVIYAIHQDTIHEGVVQPNFWILSEQHFKLREKYFEVKDDIQDSIVVWEEENRTQDSLSAKSRR